MYCHSCGTELPGGARFCPRCGKLLALEGDTEGGHVPWETCEIVGRWKSGVVTDSYHFEAEAVGPRGPYIAACSVSGRNWLLRRVGRCSTRATTRRARSSKN